jgi:hypothetical protein
MFVLASVLLLLCFIAFLRPQLEYMTRWTGRSSCLIFRKSVSKETGYLLYQINVVMFAMEFECYDCGLKVFRLFYF